ncbi:MAG: LysR substrate-binding domain-containing protein [Gammaproteobacteria bacterium]|nr:LysR substrate-binding domain-containing protein [Gammaproteobacteria bacterium]MCY4198388.1 LysR substrate-binding domain-containing protein [Gammaproteobacteria bacterium]MCY4278844.1 LysR substrate-binding domain-containing protein [Gammaproteobacteria bacterium]MCY4323834.1 LysR substrate-binding domain-containing protein [Gammaproteobacteria bacterium]
MKLQQLSYLVHVARNDFNVSATARRLDTSQPGISKQIAALESDLGIPLLQRQGRQIVGLTPAGRDILPRVERLLIEAENITTIAADHGGNRIGSLAIATTHTQARYTLPDVVERFRERYPTVSFHMKLGSPLQIAEMAISREVDLVIATESPHFFQGMMMMPCYRWARALIVPRDHELASYTQLGIRELARYPIVTYSFGFSPDSPLNLAFAAAGLEPTLALTATDADVIKTYVRRGLGVGIIASMAYEPDRDEDLAQIDCSNLFAMSTTYIGCVRAAEMRDFGYEFIRWFAPHLTRDRVQAFRDAATDRDREKILSELELPRR